MIDFSCIVRLAAQMPHSTWIQNYGRGMSDPLRAFRSRSMTTDYCYQFCLLARVTFEALRGDCDINLRPPSRSWDMINPDPLSTPHSPRRNEGPRAPVIDVVVKGMRSESNIRTSGGVRRLVLLYTSNKRDKITFKNMSLLPFLIFKVSRVHGQDGH